MISGNFAVTIDNIRSLATSADSTKGYTYASGKGTFRWKLKDSSTDTSYASGILSEKWSSGFNKNIDIRRQGGVASIGGGTVQIDNTGGLYIWLSDNGVDLVGSRIQLEDLGDTTTLYTGAITGISHNSKYITISYEDMGKYRGADLSRVVDTENNAINPVVFGEIEKTKFLNTVNEECLWGWVDTTWSEADGVCSDVTGKDINFVVEATKNGTGAGLDTRIGADYEGVNIVVRPQRVLTAGEALQFQRYVQAADHSSATAMADIFLKCEKGDGAEIIRRVKDVSYATGSTVPDLVITFEESLEVDGTDGIEFTAEGSYIKFHLANNINSADIWEDCKGFQDNALYAYLDKKYVNLPKTGSFITEDNMIIFQPTTLVDWGKAQGWMIKSPNSVWGGVLAGANPEDLGIPSPSSNWYGGIFTKMYGSRLFTSGENDPDPLRVYDGDYATKYSVNGVMAGNTDAIVAGLAWLKCGFESLGNGDLYLMVGAKNDVVKSGTTAVALDTYSYIYVSTENPFLAYDGDMIASAKIETASTYEISNTMNFPETYLSNFTPITKLSFNRTWWGQNTGAELQVTDTRWTSGYKLLPVPLPNYFDNDNPELFIGFKSSVANDTVHTPSHEFSSEISQIQIAEKIDDIDITQGLYAKWYGREFSTTDFGSGTTDLMEKDVDILQHILRLQNYDQDGLLAPTSGWGLDYLLTESTYNSVLNEGTGYGQLSYDATTTFENLANELLTLKETNTKTLKSNICKNHWLISATNGEGKECVYPMVKAFDDTMTRTDINYLNITDKTVSIRDRSATDIFCTPFVQYDKNYADGKYQERISIDNVEQGAYSSTYVTGVSNATTAEELWDKAKLLYDKYQIINEVPEAITKLEWVNNESDAIQFLDMWLDWQGATDDGYVDRREVSFSVPYEFAKDNTLDIGSLATITLPFISSTVEMNGIVSKVNYNLNIKNPVCKITLFVELKSTDIGDRLLLENGDFILQEDGSFILL